MAEGEIKAMQHRFNWEQLKQRHDATAVVRDVLDKMLVTWMNELDEEPQELMISFLSGPKAKEEDDETVKDSAPES